MEENIEDVSIRIKRWMQSNRMGELERDPYFWSIYEITSIKSKPARNAQTNSNNLSIEDLESSLEHLLNCMSNSTHIKYFFVRLRKEPGDTGVVNSFENPYYRSSYSHRSSIGNIQPGSQGESSMNMMMFNMISGLNEERRADRESMQEMLTKLTLQNQQNSHQFEKYKLKEENKRLQKENQAIGNHSKSIWREIIEELKPEIKEGIKYIAGNNNNTSYNDSEEEEGGEEEEKKGEQAKRNDKQQVLDGSLNLLSNQVNDPVRLIYKMAVVLSNSPQEETNQILGVLQTKYDEIKASKQANHE